MPARSGPEWERVGTDETDPNERWDEHVATVPELTPAMSAPLEQDPQPFNPGYQVQTGILDWINIRALGARGDGTHDDTPIFQAANLIAQIPPGRVVYIPAGTYLLPAGQVWSAGVQWLNMGTITGGSLSGGNQLQFGAPGSGMANPMTTLGDQIVGAGGGAPTRVGVGTNGQIWQVISGVPAWGPAFFGMANPFTATGDTLYATGTTPTRLPIGTNGQVYTVVGGVPAWQSSTQIIQPSADVSGVTDTAAIQAALNATGYAQINTAAGPFYIGTAGSSATGLTVPSPGGTLTGTSGGSSSGGPGTPHPIYYLGTGVAISAMGPQGQATPHAYPSNIMGASLTNFVVDGSMAGPAAVGVQYGNGDSFYLNRVRAANFGGAGFHQVSNIGSGGATTYTEKVDVNVQAFFCGVGLQFDSLNAADNSHFYGRWNLHVEGCTIGVQFVHSAGIHGGQFRMFGNFYPGGGGGNGIGVDFAAGVNNSGHFDTCHVIIQVETTGTGAATFQTVAFGTNANSGFNSCTGMLLFADSAWTNSDLASIGQMSFGGYINNQDPTLTQFNSPAPNGWLTLSGTAPLSVAPGNPVDTSSTSMKMMGLNKQYTPTGSGLLLVLLSGNAGTLTGSVPFTIGGRHGTGTPPTNGAADTGNRINASADQVLQAVSATSNGQFLFAGVLSVTPGTAQWFDIALATSNASDAASVQQVSLNVVEL